MAELIETQNGNTTVEFTESEIEKLNSLLPHAKILVIVAERHKERETFFRVGKGILKQSFQILFTIAAAVGARHSLVGG